MTILIAFHESGYRTLKHFYQRHVCVLHTCDVFIGNDSGPMHLAAAVGTQTIGLYGPGDPTRFGPAGVQCQTIRRFDCPPCLGTTCRFGKEGCMPKIQVKDVIQVLETAGYLRSENCKM